MRHLTEEEMIEHAYGESYNIVAVERHFASCPRCAESFTNLERDLTGVSRLNAPPRDAHYGERVWASIAPSLPVYAHPQKRSAWYSFKTGWGKGLAYAAACGLLMAVAFYAGKQWEHWKQPPVAKVEHTNPPAKQPVVVVVLDDHLDRSERFLVQLKHADVDTSEMAVPMRDEARSLLAANKVCRQKAAQSDDPELNTALDHLDRLLAEAANSPGGLNTQSIAKLQQEMNSDGLLFEVRVLRSRIGHREQDGNNSAKGGTI
jgi:hypothetical protein